MKESSRKRVVLIVASVLGAFSCIRLYLFLVPQGGGVTVFGTHVHHLLTGVLLIALGGIPAVIRPDTWVGTASVCVFGFGLGLALDEWLLFVVRETAPATPYLSPVSLVGGLALVLLASTYAVLVYRLSARGGRETVEDPLAPGGDRMRPENPEEPS